MKKIITLLAICFLGIANIKAQYVTIPDANFRAYLQTKYPTAFNGAGKMDTANSLIVNADSIECGGKNISNMSGLEYFKNLVYLNCSNTFISSLPKLPNTLKSFGLRGTPIYILPTVPNTLEELYFSGMSSTFTVQVPTSFPDSLKILDIHNSFGASLPTLPPRLKILSCYGNDILKCLPKLPSTLEMLAVENKITCLPNFPNSNFLVVVSAGTLPVANSLPVCNSTNNPNNCTIYPANYVNIPDTSFGKFLIAKYPSCLFKDASNLYWMDTTCSGVVGTTKISWASNFTIKNIEGIEYFKSLDSLNIAKFSQLDSIHQLPANLKYLKTVSCLALKAFDSLPITLTSFNCDTNNISKLPILPNGLQYLSCRFNFLHNTITSLPTALTYFDCSDNITTTLPSSLPNSLQTLIVARNAGLQCLPQLPNTLTQLNAANTQVACLPNMPTSLTTSLSVCNGINNPNNCPVYPPNYVNIPDTSFGKFLLAQYPSCLYKDASNLYWMDTTCSGVLNATFINCSSISQIGSIQGVQYFKNLNTLYCHYTSIDSLPRLPQTLQYLSCRNTNIKHVKNLPSSLLVLNVNYTGLLTIAGPLPSGLASLVLGDNNVSVLPDLPQTLTLLSCRNNPLTCLPKLPNSLTSLVLGWTQINCLPNIPQNCVVTDGFTGAVMFVPICNPTNNANQCLAFPTVVGRVFTDNNSNGIKDANEFYRPFVKELVSNGNATFSNLDGAFAFSFDSIGSYSLKTIASKYFKAVPDSNSFNFASNNVYIAVPDIALQPTAVKDSLAIVVTPLNSRARPGFSFPYHLGYANAGTTNLYTTVSFTYDTSRLVYDSSSVAIISNTNNTIVVSSDSLIAGQGKYAQLYFTVKPTAIIGDTLLAVANAVSSTTTASSANATIIRGSFDPNDKVATPQLTPTQVANGDWIEYTIRFQNTGNDTAVNVVLADTLSSLLQPGYFNVISTSHPSNITYHINNNIVYFEFLNINLPDSATNYSGSQGWITFKVKPLLGITDGTYINNKASIYFDYNKSVQTNLARTLISSTPMPVKLLSYELRLINEVTRNEKRVTNIWATTNEINASHFNIQRSIDGVNFKTVGQLAAKGGGSYNFTDPLSINNLPSTIFYRLQMVDIDGRLEYSPIREINLQPAKSNIRLYPNPAKDIVTIECANAKEILITDYFGRIVYRSTVNNQLSIINLQGFARGIYLVQVVLDNGSIKTEKLIVE